MRTFIRVAPLTLFSAFVTFFLLNHAYPIQTPAMASTLVRDQLAQTATKLPFPQPRSVETVHVSRPVSDLAPHIDEVRSEVRKNPEGTPQSLLVFASAMGKRFQIAILSQTNAMGFFEELNSCLDEAKPISATAKALCLREGERLAHYYPVLQHHYDILVSEASPDVRTLALHRHIPLKFSR